ncbi:hypothetical protein [Fructobacillus cardui]|uniref:hypothetical protein n=1 Tax=Fructobacillus cardui TaxID=2893170 RepID=UPI002DA81231|nr:hypothetical protein R53653_IHELHDKM_01046 [Fructobacillus cardui]
MAERIKKADRVWALYKGDDFITSGTIYEIAKTTGKRFDSLMLMVRPSYKKRKDLGNKLQMYEVDEDE